MQAKIICEIKLVLNDKQNAEIRQILQNGRYICSVIYCMKMLIKAHQIHTVSSNMHVLSSVVLSRLYIKYNKSYNS